MCSTRKRTRSRDYVDSAINSSAPHCATPAGYGESDNAAFESLHTYFIDRLLPVCTELLDAAVDAGEIAADIEPYELMRGVGNLCVGAGSDPRYHPRRMVEVLIRGLRTRQHRR